MNSIKVIFETKQLNKYQLQVLDLALSEVGCNSIEEFEGDVIAYFEETVFNNNNLVNMLPEYGLNTKYKIEQIENINWNKEWESGYEPVIVGDVLIKADFHKIKGDFDYEITINPKMSFGTGHHPTTTLVIEALAEMNLNRKKVLDAGCGTGILAILSSLMGAESVFAYDIEEWAIKNAKENFKSNKIINAKVIKGDSRVIPNQTYDIVLANINKNILFADCDRFQKTLNPKGFIILSGFYASDVSSIINFYSERGFIFKSVLKKEKWACVSFAI